MITPEIFGGIIVAAFAAASLLAFRVGQARGREEGRTRGQSEGYLRGRRDERAETALMASERRPRR